jgi:large subunit ribosomal protein L31
LHIGDICISIIKITFMKKDIHPQYFSEALVKCACGNQFKTGSTQKELHVEVCSKCHPFYTGHEKILDTAGRVEKFKAKRAKASAKRPKGQKK